MLIGEPMFFGSVKIQYLVPDLEYNALSLHLHAPCHAHPIISMGLKSAGLPSGL